MNISQWKIGDRTFFSLEVDNRLLTLHRLDYVGASSRMFSTRMGEHLNAVRNNDTSYATGEHFNLPGHSAADMQMTIIELVHDKDPMVLSIREQHYIRLFNAHHRGMNRNNG